MRADAPGPSAGAGGSGWQVRRRAAGLQTPAAAAPSVPTPPPTEVHPASAHAPGAGGGTAAGGAQQGNAAGGAGAAAELPQSFYTASASQVPDCQVRGACALYQSNCMQGCWLCLVLTILILLCCAAAGGRSKRRHQPAGR